MANYPDDVNPGQFIGSTQIYDLGQANVNADDFTVRLRQNFNNLIFALNVKDSGYYAQEEFVNGQLFYPDYTRSDSATSTPPEFRQVFRKVIEIGTLPNAAGSHPYPHNISGYPAAGATTFIFTRMVGCATDQTNRNAITLPHSSPTLIENIGVSIVGANLILKTGQNWSTYNRAHVVVEFVKF